MSRYIDGFVIPLRKDRLDEYKKIAEQASVIWKEFGALDYWECVGDDLDIKDMISFKQIAQAGPDDTVIFAWIVYASREHRDQINAKIMADERMAKMMDMSNPVFDCKQMAYGGFKELVHA
jgi:uncharacterized protein YbaA (DUF1428 family)